MNSTIRHADSLTHFKLVVTALLASILVGCIGIAGHVRSDASAVRSFEARNVLSTVVQDVNRF
jgi:hypothetical protein